MSVVRIRRHRERFTVLSTSTLRTKALSLKARGLWALCMSFPDDWEFRAGHLQSQSERDGRNAVQSALRELEAAGLAALDTLRGADGRVLGKQWTIYEEPELNPGVGAPGAGGHGPDESVATDGPETGLSVDTESHRRTGFPSDGKTENRKTRRTDNQHRRNNEQYAVPIKRKNEQQASAQLSVNELEIRDSAESVAVVESEGELEEATQRLVVRGVDPAVAEPLARKHGAEMVRRSVTLYDRRLRSTRPPDGPGWLVAALQRGFAAEFSPAPALLTYDEMLRWCEANGGLVRSGEFEAVREPGGPTLFRRRAKDNSLPSSTLAAGSIPVQTEQTPCTQ